tara:strand:- start:300 stop:1232 length:933 start_codon:yes stop_codon:yes gene_type:complete
MKGWISVQKKLRDHWVWEDPRYLRAWMDMLMMANYSEVKKPYKDTIVTIKRGEFPSSFRALALRWGWSKNTVIKFINRLKADTMVDTHTEFGFTVVKIVNYEKYQGQADTVVDTVGGTVGGTVSGTPGGTTIIKDNKINKRNNSGVAKNSTPTLKERFAIFSEKVNKVGKEKGLPKQEIDKFIDHWGAHNEGGKKMRWEMEKVFDMSRRMNTWKANVNAFNFSSGTQSVMVQPKKEKKYKYICYGCDKTKEGVGNISAEETFCDCGEQYLKEWEYKHRKASDNPAPPKKRTTMTDEEVLEKVNWKMRVVA